MYQEKFRWFLFFIMSMMGRSLKGFVESRGLSQCLLYDFSILGENRGELSYSIVMKCIHILVRDVLMNTCYIYCYAHQLILIMSKCVTQNKRVKILFGTLEALAEFFL